MMSPPCLFAVWIACLSTCAAAFAPPCTPPPSSTCGRAVPLFATSSRRDWFSGAAAAAALVAGTDNAWAAATLDTAPPVVVSSSSTCDPSVSTWQQRQTGRTVYLLGTAHISSASAELAGNLVRDVRPDAVFVELDAKRVRAGGVVKDGVVAGTDGQVLVVKPPESYETAAATTTATAAPAAPVRSDPFRFKQRALQAGSAAVGSAIKGMYKKLDSSGFKAGEEFAVAVREGQAIGSKIVLGDRDVEETLRRLTQALTVTDLQKMLAPDSEMEKAMKQLVPDNDALLTPGKEDLKDAAFRQEFSGFVETMKAKQNVKVLMGELKKVAPELYQAMVAERDFYMANGLDTLNQFPQIVAVMGIAHVDGVEENLRQRGWRPVTPKCPRR